MSFGVTLTGFKIKRLSDVQSESKARFEEEFGDAFDLDPRTPEGILKVIFDERISTVWELAEDVYASQYPDSSEGVPLDNAVSLNGLVRKVATKSVVESGRGFGVFGTTIPALTVISVVNKPESRFVTQVSTDIDIAAVDEVQDITFSLVPDGGTWVLEFEGEQTSTLTNTTTNVQLRAALEALSGIGSGNVAVTGDFTSGFTITFQGALAGLPITNLIEFSNSLVQGATSVVISFAETTPGSKAKTALMLLLAETAGEVAANANTLNVIETPVAGLEDYLNEEDADIGAAVESDPTLKIRRRNELQLAGAATPEAIRSALLDILDVTAVRVFFNNTEIFDLEGRPPGTVDIVIQGADDDDLAEEIFDVVAAGIGFFGTIEKTIVDSQGFDNTIRFSRPTDLDIFVEIDLTTSAAFPPDGLTRVRDDILAYAALLGIGDTVVVFGSDPSVSCSFQDVPGILDYVIRIGKTASPTLDDNVIVGNKEIADFDSSRITIIEL